MNLTRFTIISTSHIWCVEWYIVIWAQPFPLFDALNLWDLPFKFFWYWILILKSPVKCWEERAWGCWTVTHCRSANSAVFVSSLLYLGFFDPRSSNMVSKVIVFCLKTKSLFNFICTLYVFLYVYCGIHWYVIYWRILIPKPIFDKLWYVTFLAALSISLNIYLCPQPT